MKKLTKLIALILFTSMASASFAAGDYVWEEKFKKELPKAEQGDAKAQYAVGEMFEKGKGAVRDSKSAFEWYSKAADQDDEKAAYKVGLAYLEGKGTGKNYQQAYKWLKKSADKDYVRAEYYLGVLYEEGQGVQKDYDEAAKWYKRALAGGYSNASEGLKRVARAQNESEEAARLAAARAKPKPTPKPRAESKPEPKPLTFKEKLLAGGWKKNNESSDYLPSSDTQCKDQGVRIECLSTDLKRNIGMADITYSTKSILYGFKPSGEFKVSYRNNVSKITITDPEFAKSGGKVPVTLGWQDAEHKLTCEFENDRSLVCTKNKTRKVKFRR